MPIDLKEYLERLEEPEDREAVANSEYQRELFEGYGSSSGRSTSATSGGPTSPTTS